MNSKDGRYLMLWKSIVETIMDEIDSCVYVTDYETSELIYMNSLARKMFGKDENDMGFINRKCYEVIQNKKEKCSFCKRNFLNEKSFCQWHGYNEFLKQHFYNRDKIIKIDGRAYHIQIARLEDEEVAQKRKLEQQLQIEKELVKCARTLASELPVHEAIESLLQILANFYNSDRAYIFEIDLNEQTTSNTYEWVSEGITKEIDFLQNIPLYLIEDWLDAFEKNGAFYISSLENDKTIDAKTVKILEVQGIHSLIAVPLMEKGEITGFLGIDNPRRNYDDFTLLMSVTYFLQNDLEKRKVYGKLERLSYKDSLTGLNNRNKYSQVIAELSDNPAEVLGIIYMDLNGLKKINDQEGHDSGDLLLKRTGKILFDIFDLDAYRIGGDEFVIILPNVEKADFDNKINILRDTMEKEQIDISVGSLWEDGEIKITDQLREADQLMYLEKTSYYEMKQN